MTTEADSQSSFHRVLRSQAARGSQWLTAGALGLEKRSVLTDVNGT